MCSNNWPKYVYNARHAFVIASCYLKIGEEYFKQIIILIARVHNCIAYLRLRKELLALNQSKGDVIA